MKNAIRKSFIFGSMVAASNAFGAWDFRGEPNDWGQARMTQLSTNHWQTFQTFAADEDEFKIARDDGWVVSFPTENFIVAPAQTYLIEFFDDSNTISVTQSNSVPWNFRGTPNGWGETAMESLGDGRYQTCQAFGAGDASGGPRFKIARNDWDVSNPGEDVVVAANTSQRITFNQFTNDISLEEVASCTSDVDWVFRGTPNGWGETTLEDLGGGVFGTCQQFSNGDENGGPRFKIASRTIGWDLSFPVEDVNVTSNSSVEIRFDENTSNITTEVVPSCGVVEGIQIVSQRARFTLRDTAFRFTNDMVSVAGASAFALQVNSGENYTVDGLTITPDAGFNGDLTVGLTASADGETSPDFFFSLPVMDLARNRSLLVNSQPILGSNTVDLSLVRLFNTLATQSNDPGLTGLQLFRQFWDVQNTDTGISEGPHCGDETLQDGVTAALNGFPVVCNRREGQQVQNNDAFVQAEMESYFPIAAINRFDLRSADFSDCGEHRMIFARGNSNGPGRNFIITEARVANPTPGDAAGCQPIVNFWLSLNTMGDDQVAQAIEQAYYQGFENFPAVMSIDHFEADAGQIRTNQFITFQWLLREYKLSHACSGANCDLVAIPVSVKENPFGLLFDGNETVSGSEFSARAANFQQDFIANLGTLTNNDIGALTIRTGDVFNNGQSHASGQTLENNFNFHFNNGAGSAFFSQLNSAVSGNLDANGNPLTAQQILNRATALTCGGCHQPTAFGLTASNSIGAMRLPNGQIIDSWPSSNGFVHVSENAFNGQFDLSNALDNVFLPVRESVLVDYLESLAQ